MMCGDDAPVNDPITREPVAEGVEGELVLTKLSKIAMPMVRCRPRDVKIVLTREKGLDQIEVQAEVAPEIFSDTVGALEELSQKLVHAIERTVGLRVAVRLVMPHTIGRSESKAKRVIDRRNLEE